MEIIVALWIVVIVICVVQWIRGRFFGESEDVEGDYYACPNCGAKVFRQSDSIIYDRNIRRAHRVFRDATDSTPLKCPYCKKKDISRKVDE